MARRQSSEELRRPLNLLRVSFPLVILAALVTGYLGLGQLLANSADFAHRPIDLAYDDLQLFVLGSDPLQSIKGPYPLLLEFARFAAPTATIYALIEAGRLLFAVEASRWRARRSRGHAIVCGDGSFADALSRRLQEQKTEVVEVRNQVDEFVTAGEPLRIIGDARDPRVLRAAGILHADTVYACMDGSATNTAIALAARRTRGTGDHPLVVHSHISDPDLCATFQAAFLGQPYPNGVRVDFFNINEIAARRLFDDDPLLPLAGRPPQVMVAGTSGFGAAVVVAAARNWRVGGIAGGRLPVELVGPRASEIISELDQRFPFLAQVCALTSQDVELLSVLAGGTGTSPPDRLLVCHRDEEQALKSAMAAERHWRGRLGSAVVRLESLATFLDSGTHPDGAALLDEGSGVLRAFGVVAAACDPLLIQEDLIERLAQVIHDRYRLSRRERGEWHPGDPALEPWDRLSPMLRSANRAQAEEISHQLATVNCVISPRFSRDDDVVLSESDLDQLARREHERWRREREQAGWRYAPERSEEGKLHPGLRPWTALPVQFQRRSHDAVRELSDVLGDAGLRIVRG